MVSKWQLLLIANNIILVVNYLPMYNKSHTISIGI